MKNSENPFKLPFADQYRIFRVMDNMQDLCSQRWERNLLYCTLVESVLWMKRNSAPPEPEHPDQLIHTPQYLQERPSQIPVPEEYTPPETPSMEHLHKANFNHKKMSIIP